MKHYLKLFLILIIVLVADLTTKHFLFDIEYFNLIPNIVSVATNGGNDGAAWGIMSGKKATLVLISCVMIIAIFLLFYFTKQKNTLFCVSTGLVLGGAIGNLIDRVALGYVRDFIFLDFMPNFPVFNIADCCLCIGALLLAICLLFPRKAE